MKLSQFITIFGCLLLAGCQSTNSLSSRMSTAMFGSSKTAHTFSEDNPDSVAPSTQHLANKDFNLGNQALKKGKLSQAKKHFLSVVKQNPDNAAAHHRLGYIADKSGDFTKAEIHYITALKLDSQNADIASDLGYSYLLQDRYVESQRYLEKALAINPEHKASLLNMATLHGEKGEYDEALALLRHTGSEEQAQKSMAQLFPQGRPGAKSNESLAGQLNQQMNNPRERLDQSALEFQQKMAASQSRQQQAPRQQNVPGAYPGMPGNERNPRQHQYELTELDPREIRAEQINDVFAQIDQDFDRKKRASSRIQQNRMAPQNDLRIAGLGSPDKVRFAQTPGPFNSQQVAPQQMPPFGQTSLPGNLPAGQFGGSLDDYAILQPQAQPQNLAQPQSQSLATGQQMAQQQMPMSQQPIIPTQSRIMQGGAYPSHQISINPAASIAQTNGTMPLNQLNPGMNSLYANQAQPPEMPQHNMQSSSNQMSAAMPSSGSLNLNGPALSSNATSYQDAVALAVQMGMSAGPGQMFPANNQTMPSANQATQRVVNSPINSNPGSNIAAPNYQAQPLQNLSPTLPMGYTQDGNYPDGFATQQNSKHPFGHLPVQSPTFGMNSPNQMPANNPQLQYGNDTGAMSPGDLSPFANGMMPAGNSESPANQKRAVEIQYSDNNPNSQLQQMSGQQRYSANRQTRSETPWLNQSNGSQTVNRQVTPMNLGQQPNSVQNSRYQQGMQPTNGAYQTPKQWPQSPQAQNVPAQYAPAVRRQPVEQPRNTNRTNSSLPPLDLGAGY